MIPSSSLHILKSLPPQAASESVLLAIKDWDIDTSSQEIKTMIDSTEFAKSASSETLKLLTSTFEASKMFDTIRDQVTVKDSVYFS